MITKIFSKKLNKILIIILLFGFVNVFYITFADRDYKSCTIDNWDKSLEGYCGDIGSGTTVCALLNTKKPEDVSALIVKDACCEVAPQCTTSREFLMYENFIKEVLANIKPESSRLPSNPQFLGLFSLNTLQIGQQNMDALLGRVSSAMQYANKEIQTATADAVILGAVSTELVTQDGPLFFAMFVQSKQIFTDYNRITKLDEEIHNMIVELAATGAYESDVPSDSVMAISKIIRKYRDEGLFTGATLIQPGVKNRKVITMLMKINNAMKGLVSLGETSGFEYHNSDNYAFNWRTDRGISIEFNTGTIQTLKYKYGCARFTTECDAGLKNFKANMGKLGKSALSGPKDFVKIIKDANKKFSYFMLNGAGANISATDKEKYDSEINQLYNSMGIDITSTGMTQMWNWRGTIVDKLKEVSTKIEKVSDKLEKLDKMDEKTTVENIKKTKDEVLVYINKKITELEAKSTAIENLTFKQVFKYRFERKKDIETNGVPPSLLPATIDYYKAIVQDVLKNQEQDKMLSIIAGAKDVTPNFNTILSNIQNIENVIGNKDGGIIKALGDACVGQCSNQGGKCFAK